VSYKTPVSAGGKDVDEETIFSGPMGVNSILSDITRSDEIDMLGIVIV